MKRILTVLLMLVALLASQAACAEIVDAAQPDMHIQREITIDGERVMIDADVYGTDVAQVQKYRVTKLNPGKHPEETMNLCAFLVDAEIIGRREFWTPEDLSFQAADGGKLATNPYYIRFSSGSYERLNAESNYVEQLCGWASRMAEIPEALMGEEIEGLASETAIAQLATMSDALSVTLEGEPIAKIAMDLDKLNAVTQAHLDYGVAPDELCVEDWTAQDEHYRLWLPMRYHGLRVMPWSKAPLDYRNQETPRAYADAWVSRRGVELFNMEFVPGEEEPVGKPFAPISVDEAIEACKSETDSAGENARMTEIRLCYVMMPYITGVSAGESRTYEATPAWCVTVQSEAWGKSTIAIDAKTGQSLLYW